MPGGDGGGGCGQMLASLATRTRGPTATMRRMPLPARAQPRLTSPHLLTYVASPRLASPRPTLRACALLPTTAAHGHSLLRSAVAGKQLVLLP